MKRFKLKIMSIVMGLIMLCSNLCYADVAPVGNKKPSPTDPPVEPVDHAMAVIIVGIVIAILVTAAIIILVKNKKKLDEESKVASNEKEE